MSYVYALPLFLSVFMCIQHFNRLNLKRLSFYKPCSPPSPLVLPPWISFDIRASTLLMRTHSLCYHLEVSQPQYPHYLMVQINYYKGRLTVYLQSVDVKLWRLL